MTESGRLKVATYCRVSTSKEDQLNSFERQQQMYDEEIRRHSDWELYRAFSDRGLSGTDVSNRPGFLAMKEAALDGKFDILITREVSRLSRNILQFYEFTRTLAKKGIIIYFIDDELKSNDDGFETIAARLISFAQDESKKTSRRVKRGQSIAMENGSVFGNSLLGYDLKNGRLFVNREGAEVVKKIYSMYLNENMGIRTIKKMLEAEKIPTAKNNACWTCKSILGILRNEKYCGDLVQGKTITPNYLERRKKIKNRPENLTVIKNHHEAIICRKAWELVQKKLESKRNSSGENAGRHALSGKIVCGECGKSFYARCRKNRDGTKMLVWRCGRAVSEGKKQSSSFGCDNGRQLRDDAAMDMVRIALAETVLDNEYIVRTVLSVLKSSLKGVIERNPENIEFYEKEIEAIKKQQGKILEKELAGDYPAELIRDKLTQLDERLKKAEEKINELRDGDMQTAAYDELEAAAKTYIYDLLEGKNFEKEYLRAMVKRITIYETRTARLELASTKKAWEFKL
ncbi:MAG: recombinase family protein [Clostridia bacterium]|nr:recombinase family protein [Clostridia bacterium]